VAPSGADVSLRGVLHRRLRGIDDQRHQSCSLRYHLEIHGCLDKAHIFPTHGRRHRSNEPAPIEPQIIDLAICYFIVNIFLVLGGGCFMVMVDEMDYVTAMSAVIATLMNIGPGFGAVGPSENYAFISDIGKWFLSWNMLVGRLEMFSALVIFYPSFWKK
jgi:Trk-type K+ transport system membrane component